MLARRFGYAVSPEPAATMTPSVLDQLEVARRFGRRPLIVWGGGAAVGPVVLAVVGMSTGLPIVGLAVAAPVLSLIMLLIWLAERNSFRVAGSGLSGPEAGTLKPILAQQPWQVWPCRAEEIEPHMLGATVHVFLLDPDENVAGVLKTRLQHGPWMHMTDGYGVLWFAGDLRFGGALADPSDDPSNPVISYASPVAQQSIAPSGGNSAIAQELQRQAIGWVFGQQ
jgi:hypothetical protein